MSKTRRDEMTNGAYTLSSSLQNTFVRLRRSVRRGMRRGSGNMVESTDGGLEMGVRNPMDEIAAVDVYSNPLQQEKGRSIVAKRN